MEYRSQIKPLYGTPLNRAHWASQGLVASYLFNEPGGLIAHDSAGENQGTLVGMSPMSPTSGWVPGPHGAALAFDGSNDYVDCGLTTISGAVGDLSVAAWLQTSYLGSNDQDVISKGSVADKFTFELWTRHANGIAGFDVYDGTHNPSARTSLSVADGTLHFLVGTLKRGSLVSIFMDGKLAGTPVADNSVNSTNANSVKIGGAFVFNGSISSVSIYNRALSAEEIAYRNTFPWCGYEDQTGMQEWLFNQNAVAMQQIYRYYSIGAAA